MLPKRPAVYFVTLHCVDEGGGTMARWRPNDGDSSYDLGDGAQHVGEEDARPHRVADRPDRPLVARADLGAVAVPAVASALEHLQRTRGS